MMLCEYDLKELYICGMSFYRTSMRYHDEEIEFFNNVVKKDVKPHTPGGHNSQVELRYFRKNLKNILLLPATIILKYLYELYFYFCCSSTRLPNKAILDLCGKPTIQYLIENMMHSKCADKIYCVLVKEKKTIFCVILQHVVV